mgnify:CR=1 FL=1
MKRNLKINVIGLGYIGLPTAAILGRNGYDVFGIDTNLEIVENINNSQFSNLEPGLDDALLESISNGNLQASSEHRSADVHIVCVPTPLIKDEKNPTPDLSYVFDAAKSLAPHIKKGDLENPGRAWLLLGITRNKKGIDFENSALFAFKRSTGYEDMEADARRWVKVIETKQARREADRLAAEAAEAELADDTIYFN